jgi:hypothetical protein
LFNAIRKNVDDIPSSALDKQNFKNDFGMILIGISFQAFDIASTITDDDAPFILLPGVNI